MSRTARHRDERDLAGDAGHDGERDHEGRQARLLRRRDGHGGRDAAASRPSGSNAITVAVCVNTGPTITSVSSSSGTSLFWDPLVAGQLPDGDATSRRPSRTVDGVKSVTLFYRTPGQLHLARRSR